MLLLGSSHQPCNGRLDVLFLTLSPSSLPRSQLLPSLAAVQLAPRAMGALCQCKSPSDSLNVCESEPEQRRNYGVALGRERIGRPNKNFWCVWHQFWSSQYLLHPSLHREAQPRTGVPLQPVEDKMCYLCQLSPPERDGQPGTVSPGYNSDLQPSGQKYWDPCRGKTKSNPDSNRKEQ